MDAVKIRGLEILAKHGVHDEEKVTPQRFIFDLDILTDFYNAAKKDSLNLTVNYSAVCDLIYKTVTGNLFDLIETLAYEVADKVLNMVGVRGVKLTVWKPDAPVKHKVSSVGVSLELKKERAYLSLGSSEGDKKAYLDRALELLDKTRGINVERVSSYIPTEPYGGVAKNDFLNCAAEIETYLPPLKLLDEIHRIEGECGRVRTVRWEDRTLDIDIIFYGNEIISNDRLQIPHPEYAKRGFVITPLKEIAPLFVCPDTGKKIKEL